MVSCFLLHLLCVYTYICVVKDTTTFDMELRGCTQATAQAHVQSRCMWLNFEHTKKSNPKKIALTKIEFET